MDLLERTLAGPPEFTTEAKWRAVVSELSLSPREAQVAVGILAGVSDKRVAKMLGISVHTVATYKRRMFRKLGVNRRSAVVSRLVRALVEGPEPPPT